MDLENGKRFQIDEDEEGKPVYMKEEDRPEAIKFDEMRIKELEELIKKQNIKSLIKEANEKDA